MDWHISGPDDQQAEYQTSRTSGKTNRLTIPCR